MGGPPVRLALDRPHREVGVGEPVGQRRGGLAVEVQQRGPIPASTVLASTILASTILAGRGGSQLPRRAEVTALRHPAPVHRDQSGGERRHPRGRPPGPPGARGPGGEPPPSPLAGGPANAPPPPPPPPHPARPPHHP